MNSGGAPEPARSSTPAMERPHRSLAAEWRTVLWLWWTARHDRRAGLPVGISAATTPALGDLVARHDDACEHERTRHLADDESVATRLAAIQAGIRPRQARVNELESVVADVTRALTQEDLDTRLYGEEGLPVSLVRQRREAEHRRKAENVRQDLAEAQRELQLDLSERARLEVLREQRVELARSRVLRLGEHTRRLAAIYRWALVRRHPQRDALIKQWDTDVCSAPDWAGSDVKQSRHVTTGGDL